MWARKVSRQVLLDDRRGEIPRNERKREGERKKGFSTVISGAVAATAVKYDLRIRTRSGGDKLSITRERNGPHGCLRERSLAR